MAQSEALGIRKQQTDKDCPQECSQGHTRPVLGVTVVPDLCGGNSGTQDKKLCLKYGLTMGQGQKMV